MIRSILIVDDEEFVGGMLERLVSVSNPEAVIVRAYDGSQAWEIINAPEKQFDLVLTDLQMPEMDGIELTKKVKEEHPDVRIILMSGGLSEPKGHVADAFLKKPFAKPALLETIKAVMAKGLGRKR